MKDVVDMISRWVEEGPYTYQAALELAEVCAHPDCPHSISDALDEIYHLFSPPELARIINPRPEDAEVWRLGTSNWTVGKINRQLTDQQISVIALRMVDGKRWFPIVEAISKMTLTYPELFRLCVWARSVNHQSDP